jgi:hypothetical protein
MKPKRIQRKRTKGWKMPEGAVYVGRPTKWGNPNRIGQPYVLGVHSATTAVFCYRVGLEESLRKAAKQELRGKDLACFCPLDQPCHADVLLEIANSKELL